MIMTNTKQWLLALALLVCCCWHSNAAIVSIPIGNGLSVITTTGNDTPQLQNIYNDPAAINVTMGDDSNVNVPLQYAFPYYGKTFNNSWMYSNGAISFVGPNAPGGFCCSGQDLTTLTDTGYNYAIMPLWTDLIAFNGNSHYVLNTPTATTYGWYNVHEYYNNNVSSFEVKINSSGLIDVNFAGALVTNHTVTSGMTGDLAAGEYYQYYYGNGINSGPFSWGTGAAPDPCLSNPLSSPSCPGYQEAFLNQQCTANQLFSPACPGYAQAYLSYMCSADPLYDMTCAGYEVAYLDYQCSLDPLYDTSCPDYEKAYRQKMFNEACTANQQYSVQCPGYVEPIIVVVPVEPSAVNVAAITIVSPVIDSVITAPSMTSVSPASVTSVIQPPAAPVQSLVVETRKEETKKEEAKKEEAKTEVKVEAKSDKSEAKPITPARAAAIEAVKRKEIEAAKNLASTMGEAKTAEAQNLAQNATMAAMGYVAGFDSYSGTLKEIPFYKSVIIYKNQRTVDNKKSLILLQGGSDLKHNRMIEQQYKEQ